MNCKCFDMVDATWVLKKEKLKMRKWVIKLVMLSALLFVSTAANCNNESDCEFLCFGDNE